MNAPERILHAAALPDIQSSPDLRRLPIQRVGVRGVRMPMHVQTPQGPQPTVATIEMTVGLSADVKGTHMSRFLEVLEQHDDPLEMTALQEMLAHTLQRLEANSAFIQLRMAYFMRKAAPVSRVESLLDYELTLEAERIAGQPDRITMKVVVPVTSLCPCSKKISDYGAHNQRSHITIAADLKDGLMPEALIRAAESSASCELWGLLKRPDEKYVTERAYDNPKFVEDLVRDVAIAVAALPQVGRFSVESENFESIHNHSAYAMIVQGEQDR